ncbi:MAG: hypothetical protein WCF67_18200, partial [Chitinophagaceae bacterium]
LSAIKKILPISATNDKTLSTYFKHSYVPHYVWLDKNRRVLAITGADEVTESNVKKMINGELITLLSKNDEKRIVTEKAPFTSVLEVKEGTETIFKKIPDSSFLIQSSLTKHIEGLHSSAIMDVDLIVVTNWNIQALYKIALLNNNLSVLNTTSLIVEIPDSAIYRRIRPVGLNGKPLKGLANAAWLRENGFCYQLKVPRGLVGKKYEIMLDDLNRFFVPLYGIEGVLEPRNHKYLALTRISDDIKFASKGEPSKTGSNKFYLKIVSGNISTLVGRLAVPLQLYPQIIDETDYTGKIDIELNCQLSDLKTLNAELEGYGLRLVEKEKMMNVAVIRLKAGKSQVYKTAN